MRQRGALSQCLQKISRTHDPDPLEFFEPSEMMITGHDQVSSASNGAFENSVVIRIGLDDLDRSPWFHNFSYADNKLQLRDDLGFRPSETRT